MLSTKPFIEIRIINSEISSKEIYDFVLGELVHWYKQKVCRIQIMHDEDHPYVRVEYNKDDEEKFWGNVFLNSLWEKMQNGNIDIPLDNLSPSKKKTEELFLTLKYTTNQKEKLGRDFNFGVNMVNSFGFNIYFEEVLDGFLLFYKTRDDFLISQIKNRTLPELVKVIKNRNISTVKNLQFLKNNFKFLKQKE